VPLAAALVAGSALAGCGLEMAEQRYTAMKPMLVRQPPPNCDYRATRNDKSGAPAEEGSEQRAKLDYERQCYRHAEIIARARLRTLQNTLEDKAKAVKAAEATESSPPPPPPP
jgi:hypothetical protein